MSDGATLRRWMIAVGIFYLLLGIRLLPWINAAMIESVGIDSLYLGGDLTTQDTAYDFLLDWMATFGLGLLVLGGLLLVAARDPIRNRLFAHLVIWHEIVVGVVDDAWFISRDYVTDGFYVGFIVVHLVVIATGVWALRRTADVHERSRARQDTALSAS